MPSGMTGTVLITRHDELQTPSKFSSYLLTFPVDEATVSKNCPLYAGSPTARGRFGSEKFYLFQRKEDLPMFDALRKAVLFGAGLAVMTTEKMKDFAEELVKRGEMSEKEAREALKEWMEKSKQARKDMEEKTEAMVNKVMSRMNFPTRAELDELKERLAKLEQAKKAKETT